MAKKKIHQHIIHHGVHHALPFGAGTGIGVFWGIDYLIDKISELTEDTETIQACLEFIESVAP